MSIKTSENENIKVPKLNDKQKKTVVNKEDVKISNKKEQKDSLVIEYGIGDESTPSPSIEAKKENVEIIWNDDKKGSFIDLRDHEKYKVIKIGNQIWMAENLAYKTTYGCRAYDNDNNNVAQFGYLYDWATAIKVCPPGWQLPSHNDWLILIDFLGGRDVAGGKLKSTNIWEMPNNDATNESGFNALPAGFDYDSKSFKFKGQNAFFWTSSPNDDYSAWRISLDYEDCDVSHFYYYTKLGQSVRCIKDVTISTKN